MLREIRKAMPGNLEPRQIMTRRVVGRPLRDAELHLVRRVPGPNDGWKGDLEESMILVPVDVRVELETTSAGFESNGLAG